MLGLQRPNKNTGFQKMKEIQRCTYKKWYCFYFTCCGSESSINIRHTIKGKHHVYRQRCTRSSRLNDSCSYNCSSISTIHNFEIDTNRRRINLFMDNTTYTWIILQHRQFIRTRRSSRWITCTCSTIRFCFDLLLLLLQKRKEEKEIKEWKHQKSKKWSYKLVYF